MITLYCRTESAREDLEAFRLIAPFAGEFLSLIAMKQGVLTETYLAFEKFTLVMRNLNFSSGSGPGCVEQVLVELGADREAVTKALQFRTDQVSVRRWCVGLLQPDKARIDERLGGDLVTVALPVESESRNRSS